MDHTATPQFYHSPFLPTLHSGHKIPFFSCSDTFLIIVSLLPHFTYSTLVISSLLASSSLQCHASWHKLHYMFLTCFQGGILVLDSHRSTPSCLCILHSPYMLLLHPSLSILSQVRVHLLEVHSTLHSTPMPFSIWDTLVFSLVVPFVV